MAGGTTQSLVWKGDELIAGMRAAEREGVNRTMAECVQHAKSSHNWENRTGVLEGGIDIVVYAVVIPTGVEGTWGVYDVAYARIHELGGTIEPKNAKFLAIPISDAARRAGSPRQMANLAYVQSLKGQPMLVDSSTGDVHYLLRKHVTIPARPYLRPAGDAKYPNLPANIRKAYEKWKTSGSVGIGGGGNADG